MVTVKVSNTSQYQDVHSMLQGELHVIHEMFLPLDLHIFWNISQLSNPVKPSNASISI